MTPVRTLTTKLQESVLTPVSSEISDLLIEVKDSVRKFTMVKVIPVL